MVFLKFNTSRMTKQPFTYRNYNLLSYSSRDTQNYKHNCIKIFSILKFVIDRDTKCSLYYLN